MKFIVIGLGNFGTNLSHQLIKEGHEVFGIDYKMDRVESNSEHLTHAVCADTTEELNIRKLPLDDADYIIVSIGSEMSVSLTTTALLKRNTNQPILCRAINDVHGTILESMGIYQILYPEAEYAKELANRLSLKGAIRTMTFDENHEVVELRVLNKMVGKQLKESDLRSKWNLNLITVVREYKTKNVFGKTTIKKKALGVIAPNFEFEKEDSLILYGNKNDLERFNNNG
ncbi:ktr system potassium uptake protein [Flavobacteriaceae bacterium UJ101]|nr:ktr system potassium uptake protein [Flavobacteriaceae bacterium UJ101]